MICLAQVDCYVNDKKTFCALSNTTSSSEQRGLVGFASVGHVLMQTTLQLNANDRVYIKLDGNFNSLGNSMFAYFEGRLVSMIDE